jgi:phosphate transport system substrate-binding protein
MHVKTATAWAATGFLLAAPLRAEVLKVNGSTTVNLAAAEAVEILRAEKGLEAQVDTQGGSSGGISMLGDGLVHIAMISKPLADADRQKYPKVKFHAIPVGEDAVALIVSPDVWQGGLRALSRDQMKEIYEGRVTNWKDVGGPDRRIVFFNKEPGRGTWEVFAHWLYADAKKAPQVSFREVGGNEETRNKVGSTRGAVSQLSASWADGKTVFALGLRDDGGTVVDPTSSNIQAGRYPMSRTLALVTNGPPQGEAKTFVEFMLGKRGQDIMRKHGYLGVDQLRGAGK